MDVHALGGLLRELNTVPELLRFARYHAAFSIGVGASRQLRDLGTADYFQNTPNHANEYTARLVQAGQPKPPFASDDFASNTTAANWQKPGSGDAFDIDTAAAEKLTVTAVSQDTIDTVQEPEAQASLLMGEAIGPVQGSVIVRFPITATTGQAGFVFGYRDGSDYWLRVLDLEEEEVRVYHVDNGVKILKDAQAYTAAADVDILLTAPSKRQSLWQPGSHNFAGGTGYPAGQVGLYTTVAGTTFDHYALYDDAQYRSVTDRWQSYSAAAHINAADGRLELSSSPSGSGEGGVSGGGGLEANALSPVLLRSVRVEAFEATFAVRRVGAGSDHRLAFIFGASGQDDYSYITLHHTDTKTAPTGYEVIAGKLASEVTGTSTDANMPALTSSDVLWVHVRSDGTTLTVRCATSEADLAIASDAYSSGNFAISGGFGGGGMIGFAALNLDLSVDDLTLNRWNPTTSQYDITEHVEAFAVDGNGYREETLAHDAAGNLAYDGVYGYIYDAWNRLVSITPTWRDDQSELQFGSVVQTNHYDGQGRRIIKAVTYSASLTATYHHYYDAGGHSLTEERLANSHVVRQHVWAGAAGGYIDELIQVSLNSDPALDDLCDVHHYALHNANYNVMALVDESGDIIERYEYTPYGQRQVYVSAGSNDPLAIAPVGQSQRWQVEGTQQPYSLNDVGHQGLLHNEVVGSVYNRARVFSPVIQRFIQRDPLNQNEPGGGYQDGMNIYQYINSSPLSRLDPSGMITADECLANYYKTISKINNDIAQKAVKLGLLEGSSILVGGGLGGAASYFWGGKIGAAVWVVVSGAGTAAVIIEWNAFIKFKNWESDVAKEVLEKCLKKCKG